MPELPEVETVKNGLTPITNAQIKQVITRRDGLRYKFPDNLVDMLEGAIITKVWRRAKYLVIDLDNANSLIIHLGMSGKILLGQPQEFKKHDHFILDFEDGQQLVFNDARRFGIVDIVKTDELAQCKYFNHLGPEPLDNNFNAGYLAAALANKKAAIKVAIMDQEIVVGVGNIYAAEALFRSKINPTKPANKINESKLALLVDNIKVILQEAITSGGSTLRDYVRSSGDMGYFQHQHYVYGREGKPCRICDTPIKRIVQTGRSTFYCPNCQSLS